MNRTILITVSYWVLAVVAIAIALLSLGYSFSLGMLMGSLFLPGAFIVKYLLPKVMKEDGKKRIFNVAFLFLAVTIIEFLIIVSVHVWLSDHPYPSIAGLLVNPIFVAIITTILCLGDLYLAKNLARTFPEDKTVTFISDRHKVTLQLSEIIFIESNDREVSVVATEGRVFRNKTGISQWESILGDDFIRIHRSYIVNKAAISSVDKEYVYVADSQLPISRKYYKSVPQKVN